MHVLLALGALLFLQQTPPIHHVERDLRIPDGPFRQGPTTELLVSGFDSQAIHVYRAVNGNVHATIPGVPGAQSITFKLGKLYACAEQIDEVLAIDPVTRTVIGPFVANDPLTQEDETGGLNGPTAAIFGPDGSLYVASFDTNQILRYDGTTGEFLGVFVTTGLGGLDGPDAGTKFGPDGNLYVPSFWNDRVLRYNGQTGAFIDEFVAFREGSLRAPRDIVFHGGLCYVASSGNGRVLRFDLDGVFVNIFATTGQPYSLAFSPDDGNLYVAGLLNDNVRVFDGSTGVFVRTAIQTGHGGVSGPTFVFFLP